MSSYHALLLARQYDPAASPERSWRVSKTTLVVSLWAGIGVSLLALILRIWIRLRAFRRLQSDDPFVIVAWLSSLAYVAMWTAILNDLYLMLALANGMLTEIPANFLERLHRFIRGSLAAHLLGYTSLWMVKISFIVFFRKFGEKLRNQQIAWYAALVFCLASFAVCIGTLDYHCLTSDGIELIDICQSPRSMSSQFVTLRLTTALDIATDFSIILLSTNVLCHVRLRLLTRLALGGIFSLTLFVIVMAIIRIAVAPTNGVLDVSWLVCWLGIEVSVALVIVCLASFRILYTTTQQSNQGGIAQSNSRGTSMLARFQRTRSERKWQELDKWPSISPLKKRPDKLAETHHQTLIGSRKGTFA